MKRLLLFTITLMTFSLSYAQEICVFNPDNALGLDADNGTALTAGTVIGETESIVAKIGADDTYKPQTLTSTVNGTEISGGLIGSANPKDVDGGTPATTLIQPAGGAFLHFEAKADGFLYIMILARSNKAYTVFEEGTPISYTFAAIGDAETDLGAVYQFTLPYEVENEQFVVKESIGWAEQEFLKINAPEKYDARMTQDAEGKDVWEAIKVNGVGVIKFPVYKGCAYIVNSNGSKLIAAGFVFSPIENIEIASDNTIILQAGSSPTPQPLPKCTSPEISVIDGKIKFSCETEDAQFVSEIEAGDATKYFDSEINLNHIYKVTVYAHKSGYIRSDKITREFIITADGKGIIVGDVDGNGVVNVADHVKLSEIIMNQK